MSIATHNPARTPSTGSRVRLGTNARTTELRRSQSTSDAIRHTMTSAQKTSGTNHTLEAGFFSKERFTGAWRSLKQDLTSKNWWLKNGGIAAAVTLATCWLPGSQLFTIPLWLGIDMVFSAITGYQHYQAFLNKPAVNTPQKLATQKPKQKPWSGKDKRSAAWKGLKQGVKDGFCKDFGKKALISGVICLATCWLPGSQLILIPGLFCTFAAWEGVKNAFEGYEKPETYLKASQQTGKTQAK